MKATAKQISYINSLSKRLGKCKSSGESTRKHIQWGVDNAAEMTTREASEWIDHLREMIRTVNEITARYATNGRGYQI